MQKIVRTEPNYPDHFSAEMTDLLTKMLQELPEDRIAIDEIKQHPWIRYHLFDNIVERCDILRWNYAEGCQAWLHR